MIPSDSFNFGDKNSLIDFGIKVIAYDPFVAVKRDRRQQIPFRNGTYDYGEKWYDDKIIRLDCCTEKKELSKSEMREVIYWLSEKNNLTLWDEPDKYYIGELLTSPEILVLPKRVKQQFVIELLCQPFAYGVNIAKPLNKSINKVEYHGTAETPTLFVIKNPNSFPVSKVMVTLSEKL